MDTYQNIIIIVSGVLTFCNFILLFVKPVREFMLGTQKIKDGQLCLLRSEMLKIYYDCKDAKQIPQYKRENFYHLYEAYKKLGGNSFIDDVKTEMRSWSVSNN